MTARRIAAGIGALALLLSSPALAAGPSCHCFRDREFDPQRPAASDPYLLATAANSLLAAVSGTPKREIVQARMSGTPGAEIWVAAHAARRLGGDVAAVRQARAAAGSWRAALDTGGGRGENLGPRFVAALRAGAGEEGLARAAAAEALAAGIGASWVELDALAVRGATLQETVLASLIGLWSGRPASQVYAQVKDGAGSWSGALAAVGKSPPQMESEIARALRPLRQ